MKIQNGSHGGVVVRLGRADTKRWEDGGPVGDAFRRKVRADGHAFAAKHGARGNVEIYAAASEGGWKADVERIEAAS